VTTLDALFDLIEREAHRPGQGSSASHRAMVETIDAWLGSVIACPVDWRERVAAVPPGQGARYALALADAAAGKRIPRSVKPAPTAEGKTWPGHRVERLKGYGNAIAPPQAALFIEQCIGTLDLIMTTNIHLTLVRDIVHRAIRDELIGWEAGSISSAPSKSMSAVKSWTRSNVALSPHRRVLGLHQSADRRQADRCSGGETTDPSCAG
jgi:hypothetical protein